MGLLSLFASQLPGRAAGGAVPVVWTTLVAMTASGGDNSALISSSSGWGTSIGGAPAQSILSGASGYAEYTALDPVANTAEVVGLTDSTAGNSYTSIKFGIQTLDNGTLSVYESGGNPFNGGTYVSGDLLRVETDGVNVTYKKNGVIFYTSSSSPVGVTLFPAAAAVRAGLQFSAAAVLH